MVGITHKKTNSVTAWTQADIDAAILAGTVPAGTLLSGFVVSTDWNADHSSGAAAAGTTLVADGSGGTTFSGSAAPSGTLGSVPFYGASALTQDNANFFFNDAASGSASTVQLSVGTSGDQGGTDSINIYGQYDAYNPNSKVNGGSGQAANLLLDGIVPGISLSSSRGTGALPSNLNSGDFVGGVFGYGYTNGAYTNVASEVFAVRGSTAANLGGEIQWWTKPDGGSLTQIATMANNGFLGLGTNALIPSALLHIAPANFSTPAFTTNGALIRIDNVTVTDTTSTGTVPSMAANHFGVTTFASSSAVTLQNPVTLAVESPSTGTNVTLQNVAWAAIFNGRVNLNVNSAVAFSIGTAAFGAQSFQIDSSNSRMALGLGGNPTAKLQIAGNLSLATWTTTAAGIYFQNTTFTDTTAATGTTPAVYIHQLGIPTIAATNTGVIYSAAFGTVFNAPTAGTNVTLTNTYAIGVNGKLTINANTSNAFTIGTSLGSNTAFTIDSTQTGRMGLGSGSPSARFQMAGNYTLAAGSTAGFGIRIDAFTVTDSATAGSGTVASATMHGIAQQTLATTNTLVTYTNFSTLYLAGPPIAGTNLTITNPIALWIGSGVTRTDGGRIVANRSVTAAGAITVTTADYYIGVNKTVGAATTVNLPANPVAGTTFIIKDEKADATVNNITITPASGNIVGITSAATYVMNTNGQSVTLVYSVGGFWAVN